MFCQLAGRNCGSLPDQSQQSICFPKHKLYHVCLAHTTKKRERALPTTLNAGIAAALPGRTGCCQVWLVSCIFCNEKAVTSLLALPAPHWMCVCVCVPHAGVTKSLQASPGSPASPGCSGADQLCLADSRWQLGWGRRSHQEHPKESCSRSSTFSQHRDIW